MIFNIKSVKQTRNLDKVKLMIKIWKIQTLNLMLIYRDT